MLSGGNMEVYSKIMDDIVSRTNGEYSQMNFSEKVMTITIMKQIKLEMDRYMREQYPVVKAWASLNVSDIILQEQEPDLTRWKDGNFQEQFEKLMRGNV